MSSLDGVEFDESSVEIVDVTLAALANDLKLEAPVAAPEVATESDTKDACLMHGPCLFFVFCF